jgi:hypothetical protein
MMLMRPHLLDDSENTLHLAISADAKRMMRRPHRQIHRTLARLKRNGCDESHPYAPQRSRASGSAT